MREQQENVYGVIPYFCAKVAVELPVAFVLPGIFAFVIYFGIGLTITLEKFFLFYCCLVILQFSASSYGYFLGSVFTKGETAVLVAPLLITPFN